MKSINREKFYREMAEAKEAAREYTLTLQLSQEQTNCSRVAEASRPSASGPASLELKSK